MEGKDFMSLPVDEQKDKIMELVASWQKQNVDNRCAIVILGDRKDSEDMGKASSCILGRRGFLINSFETMMNNKVLREIVDYCVLRPLGELLSMFNKSKKEEE